METYNYDDSGSVFGANAAASGAPAAPGFSPIGPAASSLPDSPADSTQTASGLNPVDPITPTLSNTSVDHMPAAPRFGPIGTVTTSFPGTGTNSGNSCASCNTVIWPGNSTGILWTWGTLSPFFSTSSEVSHVRFYNASSIREPLDIYLNGRLVVSNLDYMNYTRFLHIIPGVYRLAVYRRSNPGAAIIDTNVRFRSGASYTLTILGTIGDFSVQLMTS